jgi:transposase-like protein
MARISDTRRAAIVEAIKAGGKSRNQIARDHDVSASTVTLIAQDHGLGDAFDRSRTQKATAASQADDKARRALLASINLDDANTMRQRAIDSATSRDAMQYATAYGIFIDKHLVLDKHDTDNGSAEAVGVLGRFMDGLNAAARQITKDEG